MSPPTIGQTGAREENPKTAHSCLFAAEIKENSLWEIL